MVKGGTPAIMSTLKTGEKDPALLLEQPQESETAAGTKPRDPGSGAEDARVCQAARPVSGLLHNPPTCGAARACTPPHAPSRHPV